MNKRMLASSKVIALFLMLVLSALLLISATTVYGQSGDKASSYNILDSSVIPTRRMPQQNEFLNNAYPFPAKPRNEWEIGIKGGLPYGSTDLRYWGPTGALGVHIRKALGYVFSLRLEYDWLRLKGLNWQPSAGWGKNTVLAAYYSPGDYVFYNYRSTVQELSLQGVFTINNINFHKAKTKFNAYFFGGIAAVSFSTYYKTLNSSGTPYDYSDIMTQFAGEFDYKHRKDIKKALKDKWKDGSWSTKAQRDNSRPTFSGNPLVLAAVAGMGMQFKLSSRFNLALEDKFTFTTSDLVDGQQWQDNYTPGAVRSISNTKSADGYNFLSVGLNYNIGKHAVEPLWWINPLDYAYSEVNAPRHMKLPKPVLDDADGDGVTDQFDMEPNTPKGSPVDAHGVSRDTDGDGVPDYKDKELITPTQCQPVDADGIGKCPDPQCCKDLKAYIDSNGGGVGRSKCNIGDLPSITFKGRSVTLSKDAKALLASTADKMRNNPSCKVAVVGYGESSKVAQQLSWDRVNVVINHLVEKEGISSDRFIFQYGQAGGEESTVDLKDSTGEEGPNTVPAPHPNLRKKG